MRIKNVLLSAAVMATVAVPSMAANLLIDVNADSYAVGAKVKNWKNNGTLGGSFNLVSPTPLPCDFPNTDIPVATTILGKQAINWGGRSMYFLQDDAGNYINVASGLLGKPKFTMTTMIQESKLRYHDFFFAWGASGDPDPGNGVAFGTNYGNGTTDIQAPVQHAQNMNLKWGNTTATNVPASFANWRRLTVTCDGVTEKLYIDNPAGGYTLLNSYILPTAFNVKINTYTKADTTTITPNWFTIGDAYSNYHSSGADVPNFQGGNQFAGSISSLQLYDDAISDTELDALYAPVPEPASIVAMLSGLVGLAGFATRRKRA